MAINKVMYGSQTLIDLTNLSVSADKVAKGVTAIDKAGNLIVGTLENTNKTTSKAVVETLTVTPSSNVTSISFNGLKEQPKSFMVMLQTQLTNTTTRYVTGVMSNGNQTYGTYAYQSSTRSSGYTYVSSSYFTWTYENGNLTIKTNSSTNGGYFKSGSSYVLIYSYEEIIETSEETVIMLYENYSPNGASFMKTIDNYNWDRDEIEALININNCTGTNECIISFGQNIGEWVANNIQIYYTKSTDDIKIYYTIDDGTDTHIYTTLNSNTINFKLNSTGLYINDIFVDKNYMSNPSRCDYVTEVFKTLTNPQIGSSEGSTRSNAYYEYIKVTKNKY